MSEKMRMDVYNGVYQDKTGTLLHVELGECTTTNVKAVRVTGFDKLFGAVSFVTLTNNEQDVNELGTLLHSCEYLGEL